MGRWYMSVAKVPTSKAAVCSRFCSAARSSIGRSLSRPATGRSREAITRPRRATAIPPPESIRALAAAARSSGSRPKTTRLWVSWETVVATAPVHSPHPPRIPQAGIGSARPCRWTEAMTT